jgi:hypothetical protein
MLLVDVIGAPFFRAEPASFFRVAWKKEEHKESKSNCNYSAIWSSACGRYPLTARDSFEYKEPSPAFQALMTVEMPDSVCDDPNI